MRKGEEEWRKGNETGQGGNHKVKWREKKGMEGGKVTGKGQGQERRGKVEG